MTDHTPQPKNALGIIRLLLWALVAVAAIAFVALQMQTREGAVPQRDFSASIGGPFTLTAPDGSTVTDRTLKGRPFALFFGFTRCPDVCPTTLARLAKLRHALGTDGNSLQIVFVSVDPQADKPANIGRYIALFDTPIVGLTGTPAQIADIAKAYRIVYEKVSQDGGNYTIDHSATVFLMDRGGRLQSTLDMKENDAAALAKLRRLIS